MGSEGKSAPQTPLSPPREPVFTSAHGALKFAFNFSHGTVKKNVLARLMGGGDGRGLAGLDGAAQAGMILAELEQLEAIHLSDTDTVGPKIVRSVITARFSIWSAPCACRAPCCRGSRENLGWGEAIDLLTEYALVQGLTGTMSHYRLRRSLVMRYFGVKESFVELATMCGVHRTTASDYNKSVTEHFRRIEKHAFNAIEGRLKTAGIVD